MKAAKFFSRVFAVLGGVLMAAGIVAGFLFQGGTLQSSSAAREAAKVTQQLAQALSDGNLEAAQALMSGEESLDGDHTGESTVSALVWQAYLGSISCSIKDVCCATADGAAQTVTITTMDIPSAWEAISERALSLITGSSKEQALLEAAEAVLAENIPTRSRDVTVNLRLEDGAWRVVPDAALRKALSGGME